MHASFLHTIGTLLLFFFKFMLRADRLIINGEEFFHPRERPTLRAVAVPTVFPNLPGYLTKQMPKEQKQKANTPWRTSSQNKVFLTSSELDDLPVVQADELHTEPHAPLPVFTANLSCPSHFWSKQLFSDKQHLVFYLKARFIPDEKPFLALEKVVLFETDEDKSTQYMIHLNGILHQARPVTSLLEAKEVLNYVDELTNCAAVGRKSEFFEYSEGVPKHIFQEEVFSMRCMGQVAGKILFTGFVKLYMNAL